MPGNTVTFHGAVSGSIINIDAKLTNVKQIVGGLPGAAPDQKQQLEILIEQLRLELSRAPADKKEQAAAIAQLTEDLVKKKTEGQPAPLIEMAIKNLKDAGTWLVDVLPKVPAAIAAITSIIAMF